ncbi:ABC transporter substrate-binding protein [Roseateles sp. YR242]|uniref:substrate-binding periplasmic protein n=1 Tax=Roseateles sp. YR242 TaxID=1855305 RepID=UPI000B844463|nr:transporter substrate-binding domain-containing protein [Roseateles sp. YR242]
MSPIGMSVVTSGGALGGVYPELLRKISTETGCHFDFSVVPRARQEAMFGSGSADLLVPATRTSQRDVRGDFIAMARARPVLISLLSDRPPVESMRELAERRELRVALVRGFDYGEAYQQLVHSLREQRRLVLEADPVAVARAMERGMADVTLMTPSIFAGTLMQETRTRAMLERLRYEPMSELGWGESGVYLSRHLPAHDREVLTEALERAARTGTFWKVLQRHYPAGTYEDGLRPLGSPVGPISPAPAPVK